MKTHKIEQTSVSIFCAHSAVDTFGRMNFYRVSENINTLHSTLVSATQTISCYQTD